MRLYDFVTGEKNWETEYNTHPLVAARFSPDGKLFAIGSWEWNAAVWRISELQSPPKIFDFNDVPSYSAVDDLAFSPDSKLIAAATKNTVPRIWNIENKSELMELKGHRKPVLSVAWSRDGPIVYTSGDDGTIIAWNSKTAASTGKLFGHDDRITLRLLFLLNQEFFIHPQRMELSGSGIRSHSIILPKQNSGTGSFMHSHWIKKVNDLLPTARLFPDCLVNNHG